MPLADAITVDNFWDHVPQPDWSRLWHTPANGWFSDMSHGLGATLWALAQESWGFIEFGFFLMFALILVPAIVRRFRWGPNGTDGADDQRYGSAQGRFTI